MNLKEIISQRDADLEDARQRIKEYKTTIDSLIRVAMEHEPTYHDTPARAAAMIESLRSYKKFTEATSNIIADERDRLFLLVRSLTGDKTLEKEIEMRSRMNRPMNRF